MGIFADILISVLFCFLFMYDSSNNFQDAFYLCFKSLTKELEFIISVYLISQEEKTMQWDTG